MVSEQASAPYQLSHTDSQSMFLFPVAVLCELVEDFSKLQPALMKEAVDKFHFTHLTLSICIFKNFEKASHQFSVVMVDRVSCLLL